MFSQKKPYSAVTVAVERLTSETYEEDDLSGIPDLVEVIKLQATGPTEAARALRKKLKYGSVHRQLRALTLLDGLIQNAGPRFQRAFVDEPLLERLRVCATSDLSDPDVRKKCSVLFRSWAGYKNTPGLERIARLNKELPQRKQVVTQAQSRAVQESENPFDDDEDEASNNNNSNSSSGGGPSSNRAQTVTPNTQTAPTGRIESFSYLGSKDKDKKKKDKDKDKRSKNGGRKPFNLEAEKDQMKTTIAEASIASTDLFNILQTINREQERISENPVANQRFERCKFLRRKILRYIYLVKSEDWLGSLLHANDELVTALMTFEQLDRSIDADSDSEDDFAEQAHRYRMMTEKGKEPSSPSSPVPDMAGLSLNAVSPPSSPPSAQVTRAGRPSKPPPRPSPMSKPAGLAAAAASRRAPLVPTTKHAQQDDSDGGDSYRDDDDDPFADSNAVGA